MKIDLRVLDHLGIKLYSNAAAVLSEAVANAWDADATEVDVSIEKEEIVISDDGFGMNLNAINKRFLFVGYDKRKVEGAKSPKGRNFMGRKGIGKLSLFSIADEIEVHTSNAVEKHAFQMSVEGIEQAIGADQTYHPVPIPYAGNAKGTKIILRRLKKRGTRQTEAALRKRIARRFSVIGYKGGDGDSFAVKLDGVPISAADREDLQNIEFLWEFAVQKIDTQHYPRIKSKFLLSGEVNPMQPAWQVQGWFGTAAKPKSLKTEESGTLNGIVVVARGRLIQENILDKLGFNKLLGNYITGQVEADFLDLDESPDIATSDRQRIIEDDPRYAALLGFLKRVLMSIAEEWALLRNKERGEEVTAAIPILADWIKKLPEGQQGAAQSMLGVIQGVELEDELDRRSLYKAGVLAFERLRLKEASHNLGNLKELTAAKLMPLLIDMSSLEGSIYRDIVKERLLIIKTFAKLVDKNEKENLLRDYLFANLWLLDPGWERAGESERMEQGLKKEFGIFADNLTPEQSKGRVDIRYRTNAEQHILVELKRAERVMTLGELVDQGQKYKEALEIVLRRQYGIDYIPNVALVFVLNVDVAGGTPAVVAQMLQTINARVVYYDQLIQSAQNAYARYLDSSAKIDSIDEILRNITNAQLPE